MGTTVNGLSERLRTVEQFCQERPAIKPTYIRHLRFYEEVNGCREQKVFVKMGSRLLIDPEAFDQWLLTSQN